jgi:PadR family transcriptional regulator, regulatory protein PadR
MRLSLQTRSVLQALSESSTQWRYGYDLSRLTGLKSGTLYPILARMHEAGWLDTKWEPSSATGRPPRHLYRLTAIGRTEAKKIFKESGKARAARFAYEG